MGDARWLASTRALCFDRPYARMLDSLGVIAVAPGDCSRACCCQLLIALRECEPGIGDRACGREVGTERYLGLHGAVRTAP